MGHHKSFVPSCGYQGGTSVVPLSKHETELFSIVVKRLLETCSHMIVTALLISKTIVHYGTHWNVLAGSITAPN